MSQEMQDTSRHSAKVARRRVLEQEAPVLLAIAVLLSAWLLLTLSG